MIEQGDSSRKDAGKDDGFWLIPRRPLIALARLYGIGARKYQPRGWEAGMAWSRIVDPLFRHLLKWMTGEKYDPVDGQHHLASVAWACFALIEYEVTHPELDDLERGQISQDVVHFQPVQNINRPDAGAENVGNPDAPEACEPPECRTAGPVESPLWTRPGMGYTDQRGR